ncbi:MAG: hypothetical protein U5N53_28405 [Mycobacterium sp.]|nr:hypothetical protein [Mycobacterium sp.]
MTEAAALRVVDQLESFRYSWSSELELQDAIATALPPFTVHRELSLSRRDRPDFIVEVDGARIAVEVKIKGSRNEVLRQLGRCARATTIIAAVVLAGRPDPWW